MSKRVRGIIKNKHESLVFEFKKVRIVNGKLLPYLHLDDVQRQQVDHYRRRMHIDTQQDVHGLGRLVWEPEKGVVITDLIFG